jgi:hypothetical protein
MKVQYFFGCILAAASLAVLPEIGLAHGGGGGGGGGSHGFGGGGGGHSFVGGGHAFGGFTGRPGFSGQRGFSGRGDHGRFGDRGFRGRGRGFRDLDGDFFDFGFYGIGYPDYYPYNYPYDYSYPNNDYDAYQSVNNSVDYRPSRSEDATSAVQFALSKLGYYRGPIDNIIGAGTRRAIRAFQTDQALPVTGLIDRKVLTALQLG